MSIDQGCGFYFCGAGLTNFAVGFNRDGKNFVWRFRCPNDAEPVEFVFQQILPNFNYLKYTVAPLFSSNFVDEIKLIEIQHSTVEKMSEELPELRENLKFLSLFERISVLEMPNFSNENLLSNYQRHSSRPVYCVELKPKQGHTTGLQQLKPYCTNCLLNFLKTSDGRFDEMYDYCPLQLFSGLVDKMKTAINALLRNPHNNLRIYKNGMRIFSKENMLSENALAKILNLDSIDHFLDFLIRILLFSNKKQKPTICGNLPSGCILDQLLKVQKLDSCGPFTAADLVTKFPKAYEINCSTNRYNLYDVNNTDDTQQELLRNCLIASTVKDCSMMISFCEIDDECKLCDNVERIGTDYGKFAFKINLIDLDAKKPENLIKYKNKLCKAYELAGEKLLPNINCENCC